MPGSSFPRVARSPPPGCTGGDGSLRYRGGLSGTLVSSSHRYRANPAVDLFLEDISLDVLIRRFGSGPRARHRSGIPVSHDRPSPSCTHIARAEIERLNGRLTDVIKTSNSRW